MPKQFIEMTHAEFITKGTKLYGDNFYEWKFRCPACGHIQKAKDFVKYKNRGAKPEDVTKECIGRYTGGNWIGNKKKSTSPCNYAGYGLFKLSPLLIKMEDGKEIRAFDFAR